MYERVLQAGRLAVTDRQHGACTADESAQYNSLSACILVLAFGNPLRGDDGIGPAVLHALADRDDLPEKIILSQGDTWTLASALQATSYRRVILVDAMQMGCAPGAWQRLRIDERGPYLQKARQQADTHMLNLDTMLALLELVGVPLPELIVYGVQPQIVSWSPDLSESVQKTIPTLCEHILKDLQGTF
jgi:hydrogenase maturation protease